ncbi:MAG: hypothetical protein AAF720_01355 [Pseudomonadota bacterium]
MDIATISIFRVELGVHKMSREVTGENKQVQQTKVLNLHQPEHYPKIEFDYSLYAHFLEGSNLTEKQKFEQLQVLWNCMLEVAMLGWGMHPIQQAINHCGKNPKREPNTALERFYELECEDRNQLEHVLEGNAEEVSLGE